MMKPVVLSQWSPGDRDMQARYELQFVDRQRNPGTGHFILVRYFGQQAKEKHIRFGAHRVEDIKDVLIHALQSMPKGVRRERMLTGMVETSPFRNLWVGWEPWFWGSEMALALRQGRDLGSQAVLVRGKHVVGFFGWMLATLMTVRQIVGE